MSAEERSPDELVALGYDAWAAEVRRLATERDAVILAHNYQVPWIQDVADFVGDSLALSRQAAATDAGTIVFCGVHFMAETAKMLNPGKRVLLPDMKAGCSLAASITAEDVRQLRKRYPGVPAVAYVNTYADVKAEVDICCTSSNAKAVVESLHSDTVIFLLLCPFTRKTSLRPGFCPPGQFHGSRCGTYRTFCNKLSACRREGSGSAREP